jgi:hypothetical protein
MHAHSAVYAFSVFFFPSSLVPFLVAAPRRDEMTTLLLISSLLLGEIKSALHTLGGRRPLSCPLLVDGARLQAVLGVPCSRSSLLCHANERASGQNPNLKTCCWRIVPRPRTPAA